MGKASNIEFIVNQIFQKQFISLQRRIKYLFIKSRPTYATGIEEDQKISIRNFQLNWKGFPNSLIWIPSSTGFTNRNWIGDIHTLQYRNEIFPRWIEGNILKIHWKPRQTSDQSIKLLYDNNRGTLENFSIEALILLYFEEKTYSENRHQITGITETNVRNQTQPD